MKKILIVFNHPAPYKVRLFNELAKSFELHVIFERMSASDRNKNFYSEKDFNFHVHTIKGLKIGRENFLSSGVKNHIRYNNYDLIIMNGYSTFAEMSALQFLKKKKIPYAFYINGGIITPKESVIKRAIKNYYISGALAYFSPDEKSNQYLVHYGAEKEKIFNYPYSTVFEKEIINKEVNKFEKRAELSINFDKVFVSAGQLIKRKNYLSLVNEWQKYPENYGLFIIGDGKQRQKIENMIRSKGLNNVVLTGYKTKRELFDYFQASDAFLFPSKEDIYGHVVNEALSQGLPVISTNKVNSALKLIKNGENGFLLDDLCGDSLQKDIEAIIKTSHFDSCVKTAKENTIEKMALKHIDIINEVIKS